MSSVTEILSHATPQQRATYAALRETLNRLAQCPETDTTDHAEPFIPSPRDEADYLSGNLFSPAELAEYEAWLDGMDSPYEAEYDGHGFVWGGHPAETY